jgi:outer membrane protein TolC
LELARQNLESARRKADLGILARSDVLRWEVMEADLDNQLIEAQNAMELADLSLKNILMIPPERQVIVTQLTDDERIKLFEEVSKKSVELAGTGQNPLSQSHPGLGIATNLVEVESANLWSATGGFQPQVNFTWSYSWEQDDDLDLDGFTSWAAILSVRIPLFSGFGSVARVQQARWRLRKSRLDLRNTEQNLQLANRSAKLKFQSAAKRIRSAQKVLEEADENLEIMQNRYDVGLVSNLQLIDAQVAHREANLNLINALYDYLLAKIETAKAQGILTH